MTIHFTDGTEPTDSEISSTSLTDLFHRINNLIPDSQSVREITPDTTVAEASAIMQEYNFSQLPVVQGNEVLGVFSFRSFVTNALKISDKKIDLGSLPVNDFLEDIDFVHIFHEIGPIFSCLETYDAVLVGEPNHLQAIVTTMDVLQYLYKIAHPFILIAEIELCVRSLIQNCIPESEIGVYIERSLHTAYLNNDLPTRVEDMTFNDYIQIVGDGRNWPQFQGAFGGTSDYHRRSTRAKLEQVRDLRNTIFHFKRALETQERLILSNHRDWLLKIARRFDAKRTNSNDYTRP